MGDLRTDAGLASSTAYVVALLRAVHGALGEYRSRDELADAAPAVEREWRGTGSSRRDAWLVAAAKRPRQALRVAGACREHDAFDLPEGAVVTAPALAPAPAPLRADPRLRAADRDRVERAAAALEARDAVALGHLLDESDAAALTVLGDAARERHAAVVAQRGAPGVLGARLHLAGGARSVVVLGPA
jgi:galactokinase